MNLCQWVHAKVKVNYDHEIDNQGLKVDYDQEIDNQG